MPFDELEKNAPTAKNTIVRTRNESNHDQHQVCTANGYYARSGDHTIFWTFINEKIRIKSGDVKNRLKIFSNFMAGLDKHNKDLRRPPTSCAEPLAIAQAIAGGQDPEDIAFYSIFNIHHTESRTPCVNHCRDYITQLSNGKWKLDWDWVKNHAEDAVKEVELAKGGWTQVGLKNIINKQNKQARGYRR